MIDRLVEPLARTAHPRLLALAVLGLVGGAVGTLLLLAAPDGAGTLGRPLAVVGYLVFLFGASGYVAFSVFESGFD